VDTPPPDAADTSEPSAEETEDLKRRAEQGVSEAQCNLALIYEFDECVPQEEPPRHFSAFRESHLEGFHRRGAGGCVKGRVKSMSGSTRTYVGIIRKDTDGPVGSNFVLKFPDFGEEWAIWDDTVEKLISRAKTSVELHLATLNQHTKVIPQALSVEEVLVHPQAKGKGFLEVVGVEIDLDRLPQSEK